MQIKFTEEVKIEYENSLGIYKATSKSFVLETAKSFEGEDTTNESVRTIVLDFNSRRDEGLLQKSVYAAKGICMHDNKGSVPGNVIISFGGLIGNFFVNVEIDREIFQYAYVYILNK